MKILVLAPHPFYQPRGTPIAVDLLVRALSERGDEVDVLTFHEGSDRIYEGVRIHRIKPLFKIQGVRPGLSGKKLLCDFHMFFKFTSLMVKGDYDLVHAVEESAFMALAVCPLASKPFIYDMDSSMTTQIIDKYRFMKPFSGILRFLESLPMRFGAAVIPVCDALAADAARSGAKNIVVLKDISLLEPSGHTDKKNNLRTEITLPEKLAMYIGNLESYQGIDLLLQGFSHVREKRDDVALVIIGGMESDIQKYKGIAVQLAIGPHVHFLGPRPVEYLNQYMTQADILVSPRTQGVNTPMKIYSYLDSGVPVLATDLPTHTQVMTNNIAMLVSPEKQQFADAMLKLLEDDALRTSLAARAKKFIEVEHSYGAFKNKLYSLYDRLELEVGTK